MNLRKIKRLSNCILPIFLILTSTLLFNNKTIEKETNNKLKALDQEGQNYRLVTSADNVQVPVPKGYVASGVTGENYVSPEYQHTTNTYKGNYTELTWSSPAGEQYPWTQDSNGIWISGNQGIARSTSTLESEEFDYIKGTTLTINYTYSSQKYYDSLNIDLINLTNNTTERIVDYKNGNSEASFNYLTSNYTWTMNNGGTGRYKIRAIYSKDYATDEGQDSGYIKASTYFKTDENGTQTIEEDIKTRIHDGGFVIYQLTDEEIEIDPNGTSIIINDTNKDEAQATRNQYVWVPVPNIEDILKTKTANNGIMQFGQNYVFNTTSINKDNSMWSEYLREPRLLEYYDKTKYYLQRFSNIGKREDYYNKMQEDFTRMIKSINKYKGFYIARYETGDDYTHSSSKGYFTNPKIVRYNNNTVNITWYDSYKELERLSGKTEKYVETGMIYDSLWDYTLKWINETDTRNYEEICDISETWGNYYASSLKYKASANGTESERKQHFNDRIPTGSITEITYNGGVYNNSPTASNNIFDLAGNIWEWTRSTLSLYYRRTRGGGYGSTSLYDPACGVYGDYPYYTNEEVTGVRSELFIR